MSKPKGNKNFMGLSNPECIVAYKSLLANADSLYNDAKLLANNSSYGRAISMLIHSTEETMKAFILFLDSNGFRFRNKVKGINNLFNNHKLRYGLAMFLSFLNIVVEDLKYFILKIKDNPNIITTFNIKDEKTQKLLILYVQNSIKKINQEVIWFSNAEYLRQDGFYVDYVDELKTPLKISEDDYNDVLLRIDGLRYVLSFLFQIFESNDTIYTSEINKLKNQFIEKNWYSNISNLIYKFNYRDINPLEDLSANLIKFSKEIEDDETLFEEE